MSNKQLGALALVGVFSLLLLTFPATAQDRTAKTMTFDSALLAQNKAENTLAILNTQALVVIGRNGKEVWVAQRGSGLISIIDTATKKVVETIKAGADPYRVKFTLDGKRVLISDPQGNSLLVLDAATRKELKRIPIEVLPAGITVAPDSRRAFVPLIQANSIAAIDLESLSVSKNVETGKGLDGLTWAGK